MTQPPAQPLRRQVALDAAFEHDRDPPGLLGHHEGDGVVFFSQADGRAMPRAKVLAQPRIHRERQKAGRRRHAILLDDHGAVVQRRAVLKDRHQQVVADLRVQGDAAFGVVAQANLPLDGDDGAGALARQHLRRHGDFLDRLVHRLAFGEIPEEWRAAQVRQRAADVGLKQHDGRKDDVANQIADQPVHGLELDQSRHVEQPHRQPAADRHLRGARAANERQHLVDQDRDDGDVDDIAPAYRRPAQRLGNPGKVHRGRFGLVGRVRPAWAGLFLR